MRFVVRIFLWDAFFGGPAMGEGKRKKMLGASAVRRGQLLRRFASVGIVTSASGFFDDPQFVAEERRDRRFLELYSESVVHREHTADYDAHVREVLARLAPIILARLDRYQWFGSCIAVTGILTRMLDRLGVWNTVMKGSVSIRNSAGQSRHFAIVDEHQGRGYETEHYWLVAPPFDIVDLSLYHQRWRRGDEAFQTLAPKVVLAERTETVKARADDVIAPALVRSGPDAEMHRALPDQKRFGAIFSPRRGVLDELDQRFHGSNHIRLHRQAYRTRCG